MKRSTKSMNITWEIDFLGPRRSAARLLPHRALALLAASIATLASTNALRGDTAVACWGYNDYGQCDVPAGLAPVTAVAAGGYHTVALYCTTPTLNRTSGNLGAIGSGSPREFAFTSLASAASQVSLTIRARSDLNLATEFLSVRLNGAPFTNIFVDTGSDCPATADEVTLTINAKQFNAFAAHGTIVVRVESSIGVNAAQCPDGSCEIALFYQSVPVDCNANGIEDSCEILTPGRDCNDNGVPDSCDIASGFATDINSNGRPDSCEYDCNGNGLPDSYEIAQGLALDCNANAKIDSCDIAQAIAPDCNNNGVPDSCDITSGFAQDCNANSRPASCDIASGTAIDIDSNSVPDSCQLDCNQNLLPDSYEIAQNPAKDCNSNAAIDSCEIAANPALDCNSNAVLDSCEAAQTGADCNNNGGLDSCEIASGAQDKDADGRLDGCEIALGDFNLDGQISAADLADLLGLWGFPNPPFGDLNGDGAIGGADLALLLGRWGPLP